MILGEVFNFEKEKKKKKLKISKVINYETHQPNNKK